MLNSYMYDGIVIIDKPKGLTSHDVVYRLKKFFGVKVGHTGTLDPMATGVLVCCLGNGTKIAQFLSCDKKKYRAEIKFGIKTDTLDTTGKILEQKSFVFERDKFFRVLDNFRGEYLQTPPMFSAIKNHGKKLYELARVGLDVAREARLVKIFSLEFINYESQKNKITLEIECSSGTYIRSLCDDIARELNNFAALNKLRRLCAGKFNLTHAIKLESLERIQAHEKIISIQQALDFKKIFISRNANKLLYNGNALHTCYITNLEAKNISEQEKLLVFDQDKTNLIGVYFKDHDLLKPIRLFL